MINNGTSINDDVKIKWRKCVKLSDSQPSVQQVLAIALKREGWV